MFGTDEKRRIWFFRVFRNSLKTKKVYKFRFPKMLGIIPSVILSPFRVKLKLQRILEVKECNLWSRAWLPLLPLKRLSCQESYCQKLCCEKSDLLQKVVKNVGKVAKSCVVKSPVTNSIPWRTKYTFAFSFYVIHYPI